MNSTKAIGVLLVSALVGIATPVLAGKGFKYTYVDAGYEFVDGDKNNIKMGVVNGSFDTFEYVALRAGFKRGQVEDYPPPNGNDDPDFYEFSAGARGHYPLIKKKLDGFAGGTWFYNSINDSNISSKSDWGGIFDVGIRYKAFKRLELNVWGRHRTADTASSDTVLVIGPLIKVTKKLSINIKTSQFGDDDVYFAGVRLDL
ncbi:MAG TPA: hypothetical protein ENJ80_10455 [Gammaproteobacteria bacterium]|nr:hypothetical protein [Gammaproteobacteria bacterium]